MTDVERPVLYDSLINIQGEILLVNISFALFNNENSTIILPTDLSEVLYKGIKITFKEFNGSTLTGSGLSYNFPYYVKELGSGLIELYQEKELINKITFDSGGTGIHNLSLRINPNKFQVEKLLPYERSLEELHSKVSEIINFFVQLESDKPDSFEKILKDISDKYISYFDLNDDIVKQLISESGYDYMLDIGLDLSTSELSTFYSYLKLFHLLKGTRKGLELIFDLLGYNTKLIEWWEMPVLSEFPIGEPETFDILIKRYDDVNLTIEQGNKIRVFTRHYVYPILRYIIQDVLLQFVKIGILEGGYGDKLFYFDSQMNFLISVTSGFSDLILDNELLSTVTPNFTSVVPFSYDNSEGHALYLTVGMTFDYLVLDVNAITGLLVYLDNASVNGNVIFNLKKNGTIIQSGITMNPSQNLLDYPFSTSTVKGDVFTLTVTSLHVSDTTVGNLISWGLYF